MKKLLLLFLLFLSAIPLHAKIPFLYEGARPAGMGRAFIAVEGDENSIFYNPAGLERMQERTLSTGFEYYEKSAVEDGLKYGYLNILNSLTFAMRNFGMSIRYSGYGLHDSLSGLAYDNYTQQFEIKMAYAFKPDYPLSGGISMRYLYLSPEYNMDFNNYNRLTYNAGFQYHIGNQLCIGVVVNGKHLGDGGDVLWDDFMYIGSVNNEPDFNVSAGISYKFTDKFILAADVKNIFEPENFVSGTMMAAIYGPVSRLKREYNIGAELAAGRGIAIRGGFFIDQPMNELESVVGSDESTWSRYEYNTSLGMTYSNKKWKVDTAVIYTLNEGPHQTPALFWLVNLGMVLRNY
ncbi:MAG: hypothetical protein LLG37_10925 [Spirochaetia bacterium]|nr:hypothetical protein [Spirochaetia bacterium]